MSSIDETKITSPTAIATEIETKPVEDTTPVILNSSPAAPSKEGEAEAEAEDNEVITLHYIVD